MTHCFSYAFAKKHQVIIQRYPPTDHATDPGSPVVIASKKPDLCLELLGELRRALGHPIEVQILTPVVFDQLLTQTYEQQTSAKEAMQDIEEDLDLQGVVHTFNTTQDLLEIQDEAPVIRLMNVLLTQAIKQGASDIHVETYEAHITVRFRIDGVLRVVLEPPRVLAPMLISRIKVMAKLDIAEKRLPQDGRIALRVAGREVDLRVSTMPTHHGERIVLRLLEKDASRMDLKRLGMGPDLLQHIYEMLAKSYGIILVTGPTGSGKSTTLYGMIHFLNLQTRNILTVEDPVEYNIPGIGQTQVNTKVEMTFAKGLRAILRQDPDVVMVGEIRDLETVQISIQASLTGHLVLSTLHTNTAVGAVTRLRDMGVESFLLASSLIGVLAQRLVRILCQHCKISVPADPVLCDMMAIPVDDPPLICQAVGCEQCGGTGYTGRTGIYELLVISEATRQLIHQGVSEQHLNEAFRKTTPSIRTDGYAKVLAGVTTLEEVLRVINIDY
jgi:general secretion pathway protein E